MFQSPAPKEPMHVLFYLTAAFYGLTSAVFVAYLLGRKEELLNRGRWLLGATLVLHLAMIGSFCMEGLHPLMDASGALNLMAVFLSISYLLTLLRWRLGAAGALIVPLAFALFLSGKLTPRSSLEPAEALAKRLGELHLTLVALGVSAFALAAAVSLLYVLQESALRSNRLGALYHRTPPLTTLDDAGRQLTYVGFPIFTLAVLTGVLWMMRLPQHTSFRLEHAISGVIWLIFGSLIVARRTVGMRGRRAAELTLVGFAATALVLVLYMGRRLVAG